MKKRVMVTGCWCQFPHKIMSPYESTSSFVTTSSVKMFIQKLIREVKQMMMEHWKLQWSWMVCQSPPPPIPLYLHSNKGKKIMRQNERKLYRAVTFERLDGAPVPKETPGRLAMQHFWSFCVRCSIFTYLPQVVCHLFLHENLFK